MPGNLTPQPLPFAQNWSDTTLIRRNDDWSGVPGIVGYLGDYTTVTTTPVNPDTVLAQPNTTVDVIANQLRMASTELNGVSAFGAFSRARVGLVNDGPYSEWNALRLKIVDFLEVNRQACIDAGDQLQIAAGFIRDTDDAVSADLGQHGDEVENADTFSLAPPSGHGAPGGYGGR